MFTKVVITLLFLYFLLRFVSRFILPILRITKATQRSINELNTRFNEMEGQATKTKSARNSDDEYIDYEEVK